MMKALDGWFKALSKARSTLKYLRLQSFDTSTEEGRSAERHRRIALSAATSMGSKLLTMLVPLITIPLTLNYLGRERYGVWMTLSSITASLGFADLGIGLGLLNLISECNGKDDREQARMFVSSAFFMLLSIASILAILYWLVAPHLAWNHYLNVSSEQSLREVPGVMAIFLMCFLLNMPLGVVDRIYLGYQEGFISSSVQLGGSFLTLIGVIAVVKANLGLYGLVLASSGTPLLMIFINGCRLFIYRRPWLFPKFSLVRLAAMKRLLTIGSMFFILQICIAISFGTDNIIIANVKGASAVADYTVPARLFGIMSNLIPMFIVPLWPALIEATSRNDVRWVKRTFKRAVSAVLAITIPGGIFLIFAAKTIIYYWTGNELHTTSLLLIALALWAVLYGLSHVTFVLLNSMKFLRFQVIANVTASALNLTLSIWLTKIIGVPGVVVGSIMAQLFLFIPIFIYMIPKGFKNLEKNSTLRTSISI